MTGMRLPAALCMLGFCPALMSQEKLEDRDPIGSVSLTNGQHTGLVRLLVAEAPSAKDRIGVSTSSMRLGVTLVTPKGQRVTAQNAASLGFTWRMEKDIHIGSFEDPGGMTIITFAKAGASGQYTVELTAGPADPTAKATARFARMTRTMAGYRGLISSMPGAQMPNPVRTAPSRVLKFELTRDEPFAMFDVVVPDSAVAVSLTLPGGEVLHQNLKGHSDISWTAITSRGALEKSDPSMGFKMPGPGYHHVIHFQVAAKGTYEVRASRPGRATGELRAVFLPLKSVFDDSAPPQPGQVRIRREPTAYNWYAGTNVDLKVVLLGEMGAAPPDFQTRIEHTPEGTNVPTGIENLPVTFARGADGDYHGTLVLTKTGSDRIEVSVKGTSAAGLAFTDRAIFRAQVQPALK